MFKSFPEFKSAPGPNPSFLSFFFSLPRPGLLSFLPFPRGPPDPSPARLARPLAAHRRPYKPPMPSRLSPTQNRAPLSQKTTAALGPPSSRRLEPRRGNWSCPELRRTAPNPFDALPSRPDPRIAFLHDDRPALLRSTVN